MAHKLRLRIGMVDPYRTINRVVLRVVLSLHKLRLRIGIVVPYRTMNRVELRVVLNLT